MQNLDRENSIEKVKYYIEEIKKTEVFGECGIDLVVNGLIKPEDYITYRDHSAKNNNETNKLLEQLNLVIAKINAQQSLLQSVNVNTVNQGSAFPSSLKMGELVLQLGPRKIKMPTGISLPIEKPLYVDCENDVNIIQKLLLRLVTALPLGKCEITFFDAENYGDALEIFNVLLQIPELFPAKKFIDNQRDFLSELEKIDAYVSNLRQKEFPKYKYCRDWETFNNIMFTEENFKKMLSYKVICFMNLRLENLNQDCVKLFKRLANAGPKAGVLPIFTFAKHEIEPDEHGNIDRQAREFVDFIGKCDSLNDLVKSYEMQCKDEGTLLTAQYDKLPEDKRLYDFLCEYVELADSLRKPDVNIDELLSEEANNSQCSTEGLSIPVGRNAQNGELVCVEYNDDCPHILLGGKSGSGKSNLLHVLINSACWRYSPEELHMYMMDFKDGVEFIKYGREENLLPHAQLVAVKADPEYGIMVLQHLQRLMTDRNEIFKKADAGSKIEDYRKKTGIKMPRILVIMDEFQVLIQSKLGPQALVLLRDIGKRGRSAGLHLLLATQSLSGLDFSEVEKQMGARIALKCDLSDSRRLLGENNEAAAALEKPYGIINAQSGLRSGNVKFAHPLADDNCIKRTVGILSQDWLSQNKDISTKVFNGAELPALPAEGDLVYESIDERRVLSLGACLNFNAEPMRIELTKKMGTAVLCGQDMLVKEALVKSICFSVDGWDEQIDDIVYIGYQEEVLPNLFYTDVRIYQNTSEFFGKLLEDQEAGIEIFNKKRLIILDGCDLYTEIKFTHDKDGRNRNAAAILERFFKEGPENDNYIIAFYDTAEDASGDDRKGILLYKYRIGYNLPTGNDYNSVIKNSDISISSTEEMSMRALCFDGRNISWFRPYVVKEE